MKPKVIILLPHFSPTIYTETFLSVCGLFKHPAVPRKHGIIIPQKQTRTIAEIRNDLVELALKENPTHILWLDGDEIYPANMLDVLLKHDKDIICGWTWCRAQPIPNLYKMVGKWKHKPFIPTRKLVTCDRTGLGQVLVKKEVFEKIPKPWFAFTEHHQTEDLYFCDKAREYGYTIYADGEMRCLHIDLQYK
jgi:hypothetical protein